MAKTNAVLSDLDKIKNSNKYTDLIFVSIKDLIGSIEDKKPTDILLFPPYRAGENDNKMKAIYSDVDYDSEDFLKLKKLNPDLKIDTNIIKNDLNKVYFNQAITNEKPKYSVSEIKKQKNTDYRHYSYDKKNIQNNVDTEDFSLLEEKIADIDRVDGSQLGNMIHSFMECYDFETEVGEFINNVGLNAESVWANNINNVGAVIDRPYGEANVGANQRKDVGAKQCEPELVGAQEANVASVIDHNSRGEGLPSPLDYIDNIKKFLSSDLGKAVSDAKKKNKLYREQRFMIELPLDTVKQYMGYVGANSTNEVANVTDAGANHRQTVGAFIGCPNVIVQGVIDAFYITDDDNIVLIDYKTDGLSNNNTSKEKLIDSYKIQLEIYAKALTQLTGKKVVEKYIYSFALNEAIRI